MSGYAKIAVQISDGVKRDFPSPNKVRLALGRGFPYEAYAPSATVKPWHILSLVESGQVLSYFHLPCAPEQSSFLCVQDLRNQGFTGFQVSLKLIISKEMYNTSVPKSPIDLESELIYVGKSSFSVKTDICLPSRSLTLASCMVQTVLIDMATRQPSPLPQWWMDMFGQYTDPQKQVRVTVKEEPEDRYVVSVDRTLHDHGDGINPSGGKTFSFWQTDLPIAVGIIYHDFIVYNSDVDANGHINWSAYIKYCLDALMLCSWPETNRDLKRRALKSVELAFISEGSVGDKIRVNFWKDENLPGAVHFHVVGCETKKLMTYAFLQFYSLKDVELVTSML